MMFILHDSPNPAIQLQTVLVQVLFELCVDAELVSTILLSHV